MTNLGLFSLPRWETATHFQPQGLLSIKIWRHSLWTQNFCTALYLWGLMGLYARFPWANWKTKIPSDRIKEPVLLMLLSLHTEAQQYYQYQHSQYAVPHPGSTLSAAQLAPCFLLPSTATWTHLQLSQQLFVLERLCFLPMFLSSYSCHPGMD